MSPGCQRFLFQSNCRWARWAWWELLARPLHIYHGDRHCCDRDHQYDSQGSCWSGFVLIIPNSGDITSQNSANSFRVTSTFHMEGSELTVFSLHVPTAAKHFCKAVQISRLFFPSSTPIWTESSKENISFFAKKNIFPFVTTEHFTIYVSDVLLQWKAGIEWL